MPNLLLSGLLLAAALSAQADDKLFVLTPAVLEPAATADEGIKRECIDGLVVVPFPEYSQNASPPPPASPPIGPGVAAQAASFLSKKVTVEEIADLAKAGNARVLRLTIVEIEGRRGGIFTGRKGMTVTAELLQNGKVLKAADFTRRSTVGPYTGADTCQALARIASAIGKDVADWLTRSPVRTKAPLASPPARMTADKAPSPLPAAAPAAAAAAASPTGAVAPAGEVNRASGNQRSADADSPSARRLKELQLLLDRGLITTDEYQEKRKAILKDL